TGARRNRLLKLLFGRLEIRAARLGAPGRGTHLRLRAGSTPPRIGGRSRRGGPSGRRWSSRVRLGRVLVVAPTPARVARAAPAAPAAPRGADHGKTDAELGPGGTWPGYQRCRQHDADGRYGCAQADRYTPDCSRHAPRMARCDPLHSGLPPGFRCVAIVPEESSFINRGILDCVPSFGWVKINSDRRSISPDVPVSWWFGC